MSAAIYLAAPLLALTAALLFWENLKFAIGLWLSSEVIREGKQRFDIWLPCFIFLE